MAGQLTPRTGPTQGGLWSTALHLRLSPPSSSLVLLATLDSYEQRALLTHAGPRLSQVDLVCLVPYSIIAVVPLSPPGHMFAFSLMKACFPAAVPSGFTSQRQDISEM